MPYKIKDCVDCSSLMQIKEFKHKHTADMLRKPSYFCDTNETSVQDDSQSTSVR